MKPYNPTLESILMVERAAKKYSQEYGKYQLWKKLPKKMMYQVFLTILDYLEKSNKLFVDKDGMVIWTYNPVAIRRLEREGVRKL